MKILHVGVFTSGSTNIWQADGFSNLGHDVYRYDYRARARELDGKLSDNNPKRDANLITTCRVYNPDIILFSKCNQMDVRVVRECGKVGKTVLWYMDFSDNINAELIYKMQASDFIFCSRWDGIYAAKHYSKNGNVYRLQGGYDPALHYPVDIPKIRDVCFIGRMRPNRDHFRRGYPFDVITGVYGEEHSKTVSETKINLSFNEGDGTSNRLYKLLAAGGFVLTQPWKYMEEDFVVGSDFDVFNTPEELKSKIEYYLNHEDVREKIAVCGNNTVQLYDKNNYAKRIVEEVVLSETT